MVNAQTEEQNTTWTAEDAQTVTDQVTAFVAGMQSPNCQTLDDENNALALFRRDEIVVGELLGSGAFSNVFEVAAIHPHQQVAGKRKRSRSDHDRQKRRVFLEETTLDLRTGECQYAIKFLKPTLASDLRKFSLAASDLCMEAQMLATLSHPNIVTIRGWSSSGIKSYGKTGRYDGHFLILDRLHVTLDRKIETWQKQVPTDRFGQLVAFAERTKIAFQIASALSHLHERNVIYRDLKPGNVGFDENGDVKLFDFGLARELPGEHMDEVYEMSGKVGTVRYMAPECAMKKKYNTKADVYSWSLVYYQMMSLEKPFRSYTAELHQLLVCQMGDRPQLNNEWPILVQDVIERAWNEDISARPTMKVICSRLEDILRDFEMESTEVILKQTQPPEMRRMDSVELELPEDFNCDYKRYGNESFTTSTTSLSDYLAP